MAVNGLVYAASLRIRRPTNGTFPDYVFHKDYPLKPLEEVEKYIYKHHHLENIPSALEVDTLGFEVAEMNMKLLEKIEELTLYMIDLKKENKKIKEEGEKNLKLK